jgi:predicted nuclease of predicted toxin-antitoxin system
MNLLLDQDVYAATAHFLTERGHDVVTVSQLGLAEADDEDLLRTAQEEERIFITRDRDYGALVFLKSLGAGVLYLRMLPSTQNAVHQELEKVLQTYSAEELKQAFVVVEVARHRIRKPLEDKSE